jgi:hypothetical protein
LKFTLNFKAADVTLTVCENNYMSISCNNGYKINVLKAFYGRIDTATCLPCAGCATSCSFDSTAKLSSFFNGLSTATLQITNGMIGIDPCGGTYKYNVIKFQCV